MEMLCEYLGESLHNPTNFVYKKQNWLKLFCAMNEKSLLMSPNGTVSNAVIDNNLVNDDLADALTALVIKFKMNVNRFNLTMLRVALGVFVITMKFR